MRDIKSLITIPLITKTIEQNVAQQIGSVTVLDSGWLADRRALHGAVIRHCCNPAWIQELISRGADARLDLYGGGNLLHWLAGRPPYGADVEQTASILFHSGADINEGDGQGQSAHGIATMYLNEQKAVLSDAEEEALAALIADMAN